MRSFNAAVASARFISVFNRAMNVAGRAGRRVIAEDSVCVEAGEAKFIQRRHIGKLGRALRAADRNGAGFAGGLATQFALELRRHFEGDDVLQGPHDDPVG